MCGTYRTKGAIPTRDSTGNPMNWQQQERLAAHLVWIVFAWVPFWATLAIYVVPRYLAWIPLAIMGGVPGTIVLWFILKLCADADSEEFLYFCVGATLLSPMLGGEMLAILIVPITLVTLRCVGKALRYLKVF